MLRCWDWSEFAGRKRSGLECRQVVIDLIIARIEDQEQRRGFRGRNRMLEVSL